jgi:hypothetical protein
VINAMSEKLTSSFMWKWSFAERRCLIQMSSWDERPEAGGVKQRVRVSMPSEQCSWLQGSTTSTRIRRRATRSRPSRCALYRPNGHECQDDFNMLVIELDLSPASWD